MILLLFLFLLTAAAGTGDDGTVDSERTLTDAIFMVTGVYNGVSRMEPDVHYLSSDQKHFGIHWNIQAIRNRNHFGFDLVCRNDQEREDKKWSIKVSAQTKIREASGYFFGRRFEYNFENVDATMHEGWDNVILWDDLMKSYVSNDTLTVEIRVTIREMAGIGKKNLMSFDEDRKKFSDVVLIVDGQKFYVLKLLLASQSPFFENLFLRDSEESNKSEIHLSDIDSYDFQNLLELIHGEYPIDESTIDGIVHLAHMYNVKRAIQKCEKFLIENSGKELKEKFKLAYRYSLDSLRDHCLSSITLEADLISFVANGTREMDPVVVRDMLEKLLVFHAELSKATTKIVFMLVGMFLLGSFLLILLRPE